MWRARQISTAAPTTAGGIIWLLPVVPPVPAAMHGGASRRPTSHASKLLCCLRGDAKAACAVQCAETRSNLAQWP